MQPQADPFIVSECLEQIKVIYRDADILVINKPSGLLSLSGKHPLNKDSVHFRLVKDFPNATLLHRLDLGTSGLLIVALNKPVNALLTKQFQQRTIEKYYVALLKGHLQNDKGVIDLPLAKGEFPLQVVCHKTGKPAVSAYRVIERTSQSKLLKSKLLEPELISSDITRVEFKPITGRTHQLRVHSQAIGHPILGCDLYADNQAYFMSKRLMLHATQISFLHPIAHRKMTIDSPCPF